MEAYKKFRVDGDVASLEKAGYKRISPSQFVLVQNKTKFLIRKNSIGEFSLDCSQIFTKQ